MPDNNWKNILSTEKKYHFRITHPAKTTFKRKGKIKDFGVKIKGKKIVTNAIALEEIFLTRSLYKKSNDKNVNSNILKI